MTSIIYTNNAPGAVEVVAAAAAVAVAEAAVAEAAVAEAAEAEGAAALLSAEAEAVEADTNPSAEDIPSTEINKELRNFYQHHHNNIIVKHIQNGFTNYVDIKKQKIRNIIKLIYIVFQVSKKKKENAAKDKPNEFHPNGSRADEFTLPMYSNDTTVVSLILSILPLLIQNKQEQINLNTPANPTDHEEKYIKELEEELTKIIQNPASFRDDNIHKLIYKLYFDNMINIASSFDIRYENISKNFKDKFTDLYNEAKNNAEQKDKTYDKEYYVKELNKLMLYLNNKLKDLLSNLQTFKHKRAIESLPVEEANKSGEHDVKNEMLNNIITKFENQLNIKDMINAIDNTKYELYFDIAKSNKSKLHGYIYIAIESINDTNNYEITMNKVRQHVALGEEAEAAAAAAAAAAAKEANKPSVKSQAEYDQEQRVDAAIDAKAEAEAAPAAAAAVMASMAARVVADAMAEEEEAEAETTKEEKVAKEEVEVTNAAQVALAAAAAKAAAEAAEKVALVGKTGVPTSPQTSWVMGGGAPEADESGEAKYNEVVKKIIVKLSKNYIANKIVDKKLITPYPDNTIAYINGPAPPQGNDMSQSERDKVVWAEEAMAREERKNADDREKAVAAAINDTVYIENILYNLTKFFFIYKNFLSNISKRTDLTFIHNTLYDLFLRNDNLTQLLINIIKNFDLSEFFMYEILFEYSINNGYDKFNILDTLPRLEDLKKLEASTPPPSPPPSPPPEEQQYGHHNEVAFVSNKLICLTAEYKTTDIPNLKKWLIHVMIYLLFMLKHNEITQDNAYNTLNEADKIIKELFTDSAPYATTPVTASSVLPA